MKARPADGLSTVYWTQGRIEPLFRNASLAIGLRLPAAVDGSIKTAGNVSIDYRIARAVLEIRDPQETVRWEAEIAFAVAPLQLIHLGQRGLLEFFHTQFQGPQRQVVLDPQPGLSAP